MIIRTSFAACRIAVFLLALPTTLFAQQPPYDVFPPADPPYYRVRYEASTKPGELVYPVNYTIWIPDGREDAARRRSCTSTGAARGRASRG